MIPYYLRQNLPAMFCYHSNSLNYKHNDIITHEVREAQSSDTWSSTYLYVVIVISVQVFTLESLSQNIHRISSNVHDPTYY